MKKLFRNLKLKQKIALAFAALALISVAFAVYVLISAPQLTTAAWIFIAAVLITAALLSAFAARHISSPLDFLAKSISGVAKTGNIFLDDAAYKQTKILNKRGDEIGMVSRSVGDMLAMFRNKIKTLSAVSKGDLTADVARCSDKDSIGTAMTDMVESLNGMFINIMDASSQVSGNSLRLAENAETLAYGSGQQAEAIKNLSETIAEIALQTAQNAGMAKETSALSETIKELAEQGGRKMNDLTAAVKQINETSDAIVKVIKIIDNIAFQTNILALNAAVEAARAGQHGKGFAVVAEEVRSLASKSAEAASEIDDLIGESVSRSKAGMAIAEETALSLGVIVEEVKKSAALNSEINRSSDAQAAGIATINSNLEQINRTVQENSQTASHSAEVSKDVSGQSAVLQEHLSRFKINEKPSNAGYLPPAV